MTRSADAFTRVAARVIAGIVFAILLALFTWGCGDGSSVTTFTGTTATASTQAAGTSTTAPLYTFAVCGDNRAEGIKSGVFPRIIESAKGRGAAFVVDTGDVSTTGSREELTLYHDLTESSGLKFYTVPGNHDVGAGGTSDVYDSVIGPTRYSFDFGGDHFIVVDNADDKVGIDDNQMQWFTADLAANAGRPRQFIFAHIPVADPTLPSAHVTGELGGEGLRSGQRLVEEAVKYSNVSDFFFGHIHAYLSYKLSGVDAFVTGGAGAPLVFPENQGGYYHYLLVTVKTDGVEVEVVKV